MIEWTSLSNEPLQFENYIPAGFAGVSMPEAVIASAKGKFGRLTFQSIVNPDFCFQYSVVDLLTPLTVMGRCSLEGLYTRIVLESHINHDFKNADDIYIREGQFSMALANKLEARIQYPRARAYSSFDACFSLDMVNRLLPFYPTAARFFEVGISARPYILISAPRAAGAETELIIENILHEPRNEKNAELLLVNLFAHLEKDQAYKSPGQDVLNNIYAVEELIAENIRKHYLLPELARRANTNACYLKKYFPWIFGVSPYQYLVRLRMRQAKRFLKSGLSVKVTAKQCGYSSTAEFSKAFKKVVKVSPEKFRNGD
ncbi:helix-turn-helix domain-containing protein [Flavitalea sp.]|nr:AraC family transcriptional regulator [Flavitalea sp.]